jgi:2-succinyl-6-hydroxy-2,4-cyclohexadiene-1-carboxylate synthase
MPHEHLNGIDLHYTVTGSGPPLLMLHGFTGSIDSWQGIRDRLSEHFTVISVDIIGHGQSSAPPAAGRYSIPDAVRDLLELLDRLQIGSCNVLGYSMGGRVALHLALKAPDRVRKLILESAAPGIEDSTERARRMESDEQQARMIEEQGLEAFVNFWESIPLFRSQRQLSPDVRQRQRQMRLEQRPEGLANSLRGMGAGVMEPVGDRLSNLSMPVLYLAGEYDEKYCEIGRFMCARIPDARYTEIPGAGHTIHLEQPDAYVATVIELGN